MPGLVTLPHSAFGARRGTKVLFCVFGLLLVASRVALPAQTVSPLGNRILKLITQPKFQTGFWGIEIASVRDGKVVFALNEAKHFLPASNMKLLVGAAALDKLGASYQFETSIYGVGRTDSNGRLLGDLVLAGQGDPNLEGRIYDPEQEVAPKVLYPTFIEQIADQIVSRGIKSVEGNLVGDDTCFLDEPYGAGWEHADLLWGYGAPVSALAVNENVFTVEIAPGDTVGDPALISSIPILEGTLLINQVKTVEKALSNSIGIDRGVRRNSWVIQGKLPRDHLRLEYRLAVEDPAEFAASLLRAALERRGIEVKGDALARHLHPLETLEEGRPSTERAKVLQSRFLPEQKLASHQSLKLTETVKIMMKLSQNLYAEMLLKKLGAVSSGVGSFETGAAAIKTFLERTGTSREELNVSDGSGLSRTDLITPESMVRLLLYMERHSAVNLFKDTLPLAGIDGTLEHRMNKTPARGRIRAKTGTSAFVNTLSGYVETKAGEILAFSIMANNVMLSAQEVRGAVDQICSLIVDYDPEKEGANHD